MLMIKWQILWKIKSPMQILHLMELPNNNKKKNTQQKTTTKPKQANKQNPTTKYLLESLNAKHN